VRVCWAPPAGRTLRWIAGFGILTHRLEGKRRAIAGVGAAERSG